MCLFLLLTKPRWFGEQSHFNSLHRAAVHRGCRFTSFRSSTFSRSHQPPSVSRPPGGFPSPFSRTTPNRLTFISLSFIDLHGNSIQVSPDWTYLIWAKTVTKHCSRTKKPVAEALAFLSVHNLIFHCCHLSSESSSHSDRITRGSTRRY